jgi:hypothetical protein
MTLHLKFSPEIEAKLRERAQAAGRPVENFVREVVEEAVASTPATDRTDRVSEWSEAFRDWVASHPKREGVTLDDSRDSIYD